MNDNDKRISVRLTEAQYVLVIEAAKSRGLSIAAFIRMAALEKAGEDENDSGS